MVGNCACPEFCQFLDHNDPLCEVCEQMEFIDESGQPRSDQDVQEAINTVIQIMIKQPTVLPLFTVHAGIIVDCLHELQGYRALVKKLKAQKEQVNETGA